MACSSISTALFSEPEEFEAAAWAAGRPRLLVTAPGRFKARLTEIALGAMRLSAVEETLPRIAVLMVPADTVLVMLPIGRRSAPTWGGVVSQQREVMTHGPGQRLYGWTNGPCRWSAIWMPAGELAHYGGALTGTRFAVPLGTRPWCPPPQALRTLRNLHAAAIRMAETQPDTFTHEDAVRGLQQQVIHALVECLSEASRVEETPARRHHQDLVLRFMDLLGDDRNRMLRIEAISTMLGISDRTLRAACQEQLGMAPAEYFRLQRMHLVHRALRSHGRDPACVSELAQRYGFRQLGRFAGAYRALFGELPSVTLRQNSRICYSGGAADADIK